MFENPRRGRQAINFTTNVPKILDLKSSSEQIFSENWRWVPLKDVVVNFWNHSPWEQLKTYSYTIFPDSQGNKFISNMLLPLVALHK